MFSFALLLGFSHPHITVQVRTPARPIAFPRSQRIPIRSGHPKGVSWMARVTVKVKF